MDNPPLIIHSAAFDMSALQPAVADAFNEVTIEHEENQQNRDSVKHAANECEIPICPKLRLKETQPYR